MAFRFSKFRGIQSSSVMIWEAWLSIIAYPGSRGNNLTTIATENPAASEQMRYLRWNIWSILSPVMSKHDFWLLSNLVYDHRFLFLWMGQNHCCPSRLYRHRYHLSVTFWWQFYHLKSAQFAPLDDNLWLFVGAFHHTLSWWKHMTELILWFLLVFLSYCSI